MRSPSKLWAMLDDVAQIEVNITGGSFASVLSYDFPLKYEQNPRQVGYRSFCWLRIFFLTSGFWIHRHKSEYFVYEVITIPLFSWFHSLHKSSSVNIIKIFSFSLCFPFPLNKLLGLGQFYSTKCRIQHTQMQEIRPIGSVFSFLAFYMEMLVAESVRELYIVW